MAGMDQPIVLAAEPVVRGHTQHEQSVGLEDAPDLLQGSDVVGHAQVVDDLEARRRVERCSAKRQTLDRCASKTAQTAAASRLERFPGQIDADDLAKTTQLDGGATGATTRVQDA